MQPVTTFVNYEYTVQGKKVNFAVEEATKAQRGSRGIAVF
jgi:hypothetical protein